MKAENFIKDPQEEIKTPGKRESKDVSVT